MIEASFFGSNGAASVRNVGGSFYDFEAQLHRGTRSETLATPPDAWGGRAAAAWAKGHGIGDAFEQFSRSATRLAFARHRIVLGRDRAVAHYDESMLLDRLTEARRRMDGTPTG